MEATRDKGEGPTMKQYELRIRCALSDNLAAAFPQLTAVQISPQSTMLSGPLRDQAELHEILAQLADMGIEITEVRQQPQ